MGVKFILKGGVPLLYGPLDHIGRLKVGELTFRLRITAKSDHDIAAQSGASSRHTQTVEFLDYETNDGDHEFDHVPYEDDRFAWAAGLFLGGTATQLRVESDTTVFVLIHGEQALVQREQLRQIDTATMAGPIWCPVANMKAERPYGPGGVEIKRGSKHFAPGAKLYCSGSSWGPSYYDQIQVVGHHRRSHRFVTMIVSSSWLTNWRVELAYSPYVIRAF